MSYFSAFLSGQDRKASEQEEFQRMARSRFFRTLLAVTTFVFLFDSCTSFYTAKPVPLTLPSQLKTRSTVPGTEIQVGIKPYNTPHRIHSLFGRNGLWRKHILPLQISLESDDPRPAVFLIHSAYIISNGKYYPAIIPNAVYDISWQAKHPYVVVKEVLYYTGVFLFTIVTLGLGSLIWVLPTPFGEPSPQDSPFGRDLSYKAYAKDVKLQDGSLRGGFLYFALPRKDIKLSDAHLVLHFSQNHEKKPGSVERTVTIPLTPGLHINNNVLKDWVNGFLQ